MFDELRNALMAHFDKNIIDFFKNLLKAATINGSRALGLNKGIEKDFWCRYDLFNLPDEVEDKLKI